MWLGEQITERGIGNGMSLLIFTGIVVGLPRGIADLVEKAKNDAWGAFTFPAILMLLLLMVAVVAFIVYVERSERRIPVQYAKRVVGRKVMGGQSTHLPLRVNAGGVMPVIFASSILALPQMLGTPFKNNKIIGPMLDALRWGEPLYATLYAVGIIFFAYFYISIVFNPNDPAALNPALAEAKAAGMIGRPESLASAMIPGPALRRAFFWKSAVMPMVRPASSAAFIARKLVTAPFLCMRARSLAPEPRITPQPTF